jgi:hypothetical protein
VVTSGVFLGEGGGNEIGISIDNLIRQLLGSLLSAFSTLDHLASPYVCENNQLQLEITT